MKKETVALTIALLLIAGSFVSSRFIREEPREAGPTPDSLSVRYGLSIWEVSDTTRRLITGYNYKLLELFAANHHQDMTVILSPREASPVDSLLEGRWEILAVPYGDTLGLAPEVRDSLAFSIPIDSTTVWVTRKDGPIDIRFIDGWLAGHLNSPEDSVDRERFFNVYSPARARQRDYLSPYDDIIRTCADSLGWDWRMLAAVIYQESHFHMEAVSPKGAAGLFQIVPQTAAAVGLTDPHNPALNIAGGARLLRMLSARYDTVGDNTTEKFKYTLAAFNAGHGRIADCIAYALYRGRNPSYWANVVALIPEMRDEDIVETGVVKCGPFQGYETIRYVDLVVDTYL